jgi:glycosyltransferase involved in cell wall biosynthesis
MTRILIAFNLLVLLYWLIWSVVLARGTRRLRTLRALATALPDAAPSVSVVLAARNEETTLAPALGSLLALDYPGLEFLVVDDRSTDATPALVAAMAARHPALRVLRVETLPPGWLGKTHALAVGAAAARGDWILFTDADVHFAPDALRRAVAYAVAEGVDHLVAAPELVLEHYGERVLIATFRTCFNQAVRPWRARDPESPSAIGLGAFNLVRRSAYERAGGHGAVRLAVDEDMRLGRALKRAGARQEMILTGELVRVRWHDGVRATIRGLTKNFFGAMDYRVRTAALIVAMLLVMHTASFVSLWIADSWPGRVAALAAWLATALAYRAAGESFRAGLGAPAGGLLTAVAIARSTLVTLIRGGVDWRGTFYPLGELRAFVRREGGRPVLRRGAQARRAAWEVRHE